jgi:hypothetical protein
MLIISSLQIASQYVQVPDADSIVRDNGFLRLADGVDTGWVLAPAITPTMATQYIGFDLRPHEWGISVAVRRPGDSYYGFVQNSWVETSGPVYYDATQIRSSFAQWAGPIQFRLRLQRDAESGESPKLQCLRAGYRVEGNFLAYLMEYVVRPWCRAPIRMIRNVQSQDGIFVNLPSRLNHLQMSDIQALTPGVAPRGVTVQPSPLRLQITPETTPGMVQLQFVYTPEAIHVTGIYQISEVPIVLIRLLPGENHRRINQSDWVQSSPGVATLWSTTFQYDQPVEFEVLAHEFDDAMSIAQSLVSRINHSGCLAVPAFGTAVFMRVRTGVQIGEPLQREGNLFSVKLRATIIGLLEGDHDTTAPLLTEFERDFVPQQ